MPNNRMPVREDYLDSDAFPPRGVKAAPLYDEAHAYWQSQAYVQDGPPLDVISGYML